MRLKNILLVVSDMDRSKDFYHDLFGLQIMRNFGDNVILSGELVLQEKKSWEQQISSDIAIGNGTELFFEEADLDGHLIEVAEA